MKQIIFHIWHKHVYLTNLTLVAKGQQMLESKSGDNSMNLWDQPALFQQSRLQVI